MAKPLSKHQVRLLQKTKAVIKLIDIRTAAEFERQHVTHATHIPTDELANNLESFEKDDTIVCICNYGKERSQEAADLLQNAGFEKTYFLEGGTAEWYNND